MSAIHAHEFSTRPSRSVKDQLVGTWRLVSWTVKEIESEIIDYPFGQCPLGWIMYRSEGYMGVAIMRPDRGKFTSNNLVEATPEEIKAGFEGYISYFGTYEVSEHEHFVIHHLQLSWFPNLVGTDQKRYFELSGNRLTLKTPPLSLLGEGQVHRLVWDRLI